MATCSLHPDQSSTAICEVCHRNVCGQCTSSRYVALTCLACAGEKDAAARRRRMVMGVALVPVAVLAILGVIQLAGWLSPTAVAAREAVAAKAKAQAVADAEAEQLLTTLRATPCSRQALIPALEKLLKAKRADVVLKEVAHFETECGVWPRAWWLTYSAYEQRGEYVAAAGEATKLIEDDPDDRDFWWWRGRAYFNQGDFERAEPDYRRVRELCPTCLVGWATADTLEKLERPCEAIAPLVQSLVMHPRLGNADAVRRRIDRLSALPACAAIEGTGNLKLPLTRGHAYARGSINGIRTEFLVDTGATSVAVSSLAAKAMGLDALPALMIESQTANGRVKVRQVIADRIEVGTLAATAVPVVIMPDLDGPALLGMSFLGRFDVVMDAKAVELRSRAAKASR